jgi:hypothetical protein
MTVATLCISLAYPPAARPGGSVRTLSDPDAVLEAMIEWTRRYGDVPTMADWDPVRPGG